MFFRLFALFYLLPMVQSQQSEDPFYFMNRGMLMMGQGMTEILTNQKFNGEYHSGLMEPHDMQNHMVQEQWYKDYYGKDTGTQAPTAYEQYQRQYQQYYGQQQAGGQNNYNYNNYYGNSQYRLF